MGRYIKLATIKELFATSGNTCAYTECSEKIFTDGIDIGTIVHIEGLSPKGPRYNANQTDTVRNSFDNLMLMCRNHHAIVDYDVENHTVELLKEWKLRHEKFWSQIPIDKALLSEFANNIKTQLNRINVAEDEPFDTSKFSNAIYHYSSAGPKTKEHVFETELRPILSSIPEDRSIWTDAIRSTINDLLNASLLEIKSGVLVQSWLDVLITIVDRWDNKTHSVYFESISKEVKELWKNSRPSPLLIMLTLKLRDYKIRTFETLILMSLKWTTDEFNALEKHIDFFNFCKKHPQKVSALKEKILKLMNASEIKKKEETYRRLKWLDTSLKQHC